jgi:Spy/CpxP family protein refolding chaperone
MRHGGGRTFNRRGAMGMRLRLAQLDLTDAQRTKLRDLHEAQARKAIQRRADMQLARMDLRKLMRADKPDVGAVNAQIDKIARMQAEGMKAAFETRIQARAVLTPEQLKKLQAPMDPMMRHEMMDTPDGAPKR